MQNGLPNEVNELIRMALQEDIGDGDVSAEFFVDAGAQAEAVILAKQTGVLGGMGPAAAVFQRVDAGILVESVLEDGIDLIPGTVVMRLKGSARGILTGERTALNFLQRLSGVATATRSYVEAVAGTGAKVLDTRKTTPGWRWLEKAAVKSGGGTNHRHGLYDMAMVKDNHLAEIGNLARIQEGIDRLQAAKPGIKVELEADTVEQVEGFLQLTGVSFILLDNMSLEEMRRCVALVKLSGSEVKLEASGGITLATIRGIAETGVDFISSGALTHSVKALDLSLDFDGTRY